MRPRPYNPPPPPAESAVPPGRNRAARRDSAGGAGAKANFTGDLKSIPMLRDFSRKFGGVNKKTSPYNSAGFFVGNWTSVRLLYFIFVVCRGAARRRSRTRKRGIFARPASAPPNSARFQRNSDGFKGEKRPDYGEQNSHVFVFGLGIGLRTDRQQNEKREKQPASNLSNVSANKKTLQT